MGHLLVLVRIGEVYPRGSMYDSIRIEILDYGHSSQLFFIFVFFFLWLRLSLRFLLLSSRRGRKVRVVFIGDVVWR
jgi:hypothetical protein